MDEEQQSNSKIEAFSKLIIFLFISLISFAAGTFVGKNLGSMQSNTIQSEEIVDLDTQLAMGASGDNADELADIENKEISAVAGKFLEAKDQKIKELEDSSALDTDEALPQSTNYKYTIQVASFAKESEAQSKVRELKRSGFEKAFYVPAVVNDKTWYRVGTSLFDDYKAAAIKKDELTSKGAITDAFVQKVDM